MRKKSKFSILSFNVLIFVLILANSCDPTVSIKLLPVLTTNETTLITQNTATSGGNISSENGFEVTARGVCYSLKPNPTIKDSLIKDAAGIDTFTSPITNLLADTTYYVRAYATNKNGTAYGLQVTFKTLPLPGISTTTIKNINVSTATSGGNITSNGGTQITSRGICWNTSANPTLSNFHTTDGIGTGTFTSNLTGLNPETTYYLRAYATNSNGTFYGNQINLKTLTATGTLLDIDGNVYHYITIGTQTWMVENLKTTKYNDGNSIPLVTDNTTWTTLSTPTYCWYNNDAMTYKDKYGALYNWFTVNTSKLAPTGWHVATDTEWTNLTDYVSSNLGSSLSVAKALAATIDWATNNTTGEVGCNLTLNNATGFSALPSGCRYNDGTFFTIGGYGTWWSSTEHYSSTAWYRGMGYDDSTVYQASNSKSNGFSVRCVRDN